jgi:hypothetical protein
MSKLPVYLHDGDCTGRIRDKRYPNFALMKLSAYHKLLGDEVYWFHTHYHVLDDFKAVYSSKVFRFSPESCSLPKGTIKGGTGYGLFGELPPEVDKMKPDYSIYASVDAAYGFTTRGCPNKCRYCIVPAKEGGIRAYADWRDIVRPDSKKLVLMDANILAHPHGIDQIRQLAKTDYRLDINQGMQASLVTGEIAEILSKIRWQRYIRFSCDTDAALEPVTQAVKALASHGIKPDKVCVYMLVTADLDSAERRVRALHDLGVAIYAQAEHNEQMGIVPTKVQRDFTQRYCYSRRYTKETWAEYAARHKLRGA